MGGERACESRREAGMKSAVSRECVMGEKRGAWNGESAYGQGEGVDKRRGSAKGCVKGWCEGDRRGR
ncbi:MULTISPECIES: hypothetical protein [unclassified Bartonella]|uniref:hypothetical protein n=1 Tax=unclassified Bartonella TaxID=2645622 RepID=UPI0035CF63CF